MMMHPQVALLDGTKGLFLRISAVALLISLLGGIPAILGERPAAEWEVRQKAALELTNDYTTPLNYTIDYQYNSNATGGGGGATDPRPPWAEWVELPKWEIGGVINNVDDQPFTRSSALVRMGFFPSIRLRNSRIAVSLYVSPNGFITPSTVLPCPYFCGEYYKLGGWPMIGLYIDDLNPQEKAKNASIKMAKRQDCLEVMFTNIPRFGTVSAAALNLTAQATICGNGTIVFRYRQVPNVSPKRNPLIGIFYSKEQFVHAETPVPLSDGRPSIAAMRITPSADRCNLQLSCGTCAKLPGCVWCTALSVTSYFAPYPHAQAWCVSSAAASDWCFPTDQFEGQCNHSKIPVQHYRVTPTIDTGGGGGRIKEKLWTVLPHVWSSGVEVHLPFSFPMYYAPISGVYDDNHARMYRKLFVDIGGNIVTPDNLFRISSIGHPSWDYLIRNVTVSTAMFPHPTLVGDDFCTEVNAQGRGFCFPTAVFRFSWYSPSAVYGAINPVSVNCFVLLASTGSVAMSCSSTDTILELPWTMFPGIFPKAENSPSRFGPGLPIPWSMLSTTGSYVRFDPVPTCPACTNGGVCDPMTRRCSCSGGFTGDSCERCNRGLYLRANPLNASEKVCAPCLECQNGAECSPTTGLCLCKSPWDGRLCEDKCSTNYTADSCSTATCDPRFHNCHCGRCVCGPSTTAAALQARCVASSSGEGGSMVLKGFLVVLATAFVSLLPFCTYHYLIQPCLRRRRQRHQRERQQVARTRVAALIQSTLPEEPGEDDLFPMLSTNPLARDGAQPRPPPRSSSSSLDSELEMSLLGGGDQSPEGDGAAASRLGVPEAHSSDDDIVDDAFL